MRNGHSAISWIIGIVLVSLLTWISVIFTAQDIEEDLTARALEALATQHSWATVEVSGRDVIVSGNAPSDDARNEVLRIVDGAWFDRESGTWGVRVVDGTLIKGLPVVSSYKTGFSIDNGTITLTGFVPSESFRAEVLSATENLFDNKAAIDDLVLAAGAPEELNGQVEFALKQLSRLASGSVSLSDSVISIEGRSQNERAYLDILSDMKMPLPVGLSAGSLNIIPPKAAPYRFKVTMNDDRLVLSGNIPDEHHRSAIVALAAKMRDNRTLSDRLRLASGAHAAYQQQVAFALMLLTKLEEGVVSLADQTLDISGRANDEEIAHEIKKQLIDALPDGLLVGKVAISAPLKLVATPPPVKKPVSETVAADPGVVTTQSPDISAGLGEAEKTLPENQQNNDNEPKPITSDKIVGADTAGTGEQDHDELTPPSREEGEQQSTPVQPGPFIFSAEKLGSDIKLNGLVSSDENRNQILGAAREAAQGRVVDNLSVQPEVPDDISALILIAMRQLKRMESGTLTTFDTTLSLDGIALDPVQLENIRADLRTLPQGTSLGAIDLDVIKISPYQLTLIKNGEEQFFSGYVPTAKIKNELVKRAHDLALDNVDDRTRIGAGAPEHFGKALSYALHVLSRFSDGSIRLYDELVVIDGTAKTPDFYDDALELSKKPPSGFEVISAEIDLPIVAPYSWSVSRSEATVTLRGFVPDEAIRSAIRQEFRGLGDSDLIDETRLAHGMPADVNWHAATIAASRTMAFLDDGQIRLDDTLFSVNGEARDFDAYDGFDAALSGLRSEGLSERDIVLLRPEISPFTLSAERDGDHVSISGFLPEGKDRELSFAAKRRFGTNSTTFSTRVARGAPRGFVTATKAAIQGLSRFSDGQFQILDQTITLSGTVPFGAPVDQIEREFRESLPPGFSASVSLKQAAPPPQIMPDECSAQILRRLSSNKVYFSSAQAAILSDSFGLLDEIAETALSCPDARFQIAGHTDSDGSEDSNQRLSQARAVAVAQYLARSGVGSDRLEPIGFGETLPIADNLSEKNKALNRRIEFSLVNN